MNNLQDFQRLKQIESKDATMEDSNPIVLARGEGSFVWDADGKKYKDLCAGFGALALGHNHPRLKSILKKASLYQGMGDVYASLPKVECLETLRSLLPKELSHGALAVTGSQAAEMAIKTAALSSGGSGVICFSGGYHGLDLGVLPFAGRDDFRDPFASLLLKENIERAPYGAPMEILEKSLENFKKKNIKPSCVIVEPILGRGGVVLPPKGWLKELSDFCKRNNILFILDEILTGLGRTGSYTKAFSVPCDIVCLGKILGGGFPISACFAKESVMKSWDLGQAESLHTGTFFGHPLMCELAAETLKEIKESSLCERSLKLGQEIALLIKESLKDFPEFKELRSEGLLFGLEFRAEGFALKLMEALKEEGVLVIPCGKDARTLSLTPALTIEKSVLEDSVRLIKKCVSKIASKN